MDIKIPFRLNYKGVKPSFYDEDIKRMKDDAKKFDKVIKYALKNADKWYDKAFGK